MSYTSDTDVNMRGREFNGAQLRYYRQAAGLRINQLAQAIGCSPGHLRLAEGQTRRLSPELAGTAAKVLTQHGPNEVTIDDIYQPTQKSA